MWQKMHTRSTVDEVLFCYRTCLIACLLNNLFKDQMQALPGSSMSGGVGVARAQHFHQQRSANDERVYDPQRELQQNISRQIGQLIHSLVVHSSYL